MTARGSFWPLWRGLTLIHVIDKVVREGELLDTARDCFNFVTTFFEPTNASATHIYHSALDCSLPFDPLNPPLGP